MLFLGASREVQQVGPRWILKTKDGEERIGAMYCRYGRLGLVTSKLFNFGAIKFEMLSGKAVSVRAVNFRIYCIRCVTSKISTHCDGRGFLGKKHLKRHQYNMAELHITARSRDFITANRAQNY